ncbi:hypothetical protein OPV22_008741 [Ensete ventricosum]|uniref:Uncharacterized protein n=1 Tax=Ensete ventricosum TaxID=4639 RepID=A0AAV8PQH0_ENSVE|nr:hypothetical protein OPV22_008741 [Ensete ventricosum]
MLFGVAALYGLGWNLEELGFIMVTASIADDCFDSGKRNDQSHSLARRKVIAEQMTTAQHSTSLCAGYELSKG